MPFKHRPTRRSFDLQIYEDIQISDEHRSEFEKIFVEAVKLAMLDETSHKHPRRESIELANYDVVQDSNVARNMGPKESVYEKEKRIFYDLLPELLGNEEYRDKFVAISGCKVVDSDVNKIPLIRRVFASRGYVPIFVEKVAIKERIIELPSPERV